MSFADWAPPYDGGLGALAAVSNLSCCCSLARLLLRPLRIPELSAVLGGRAAYRLAAACSWVFGEEALGILRAGLQATQALALAGSHGA